MLDGGGGESKRIRLGFRVWGLGFGMDGMDSRDTLYQLLQKAGRTREGTPTKSP